MSATPQHQPVAELTAIQSAALDRMRIFSGPGSSLICDECQRIGYSIHNHEPGCRIGAILATLRTGVS